MDVTILKSTPSFWQTAGHNRPQVAMHTSLNYVSCALEIKSRQSLDDDRHFVLLTHTSWIKADQLLEQFRLNIEIAKKESAN